MTNRERIIKTLKMMREHYFHLYEKADVEDRARDAYWGCATAYNNAIDLLEAEENGDDKHLIAKYLEAMDKRDMDTGEGLV